MAHPDCLPPDSDATLPKLTWAGQLADQQQEQSYRQSSWSRTLRLLGWACLIAALFYTLAGLGPLMEFGWTALAVALGAARIAIYFVALALFFYSRKACNEAKVQQLLVLFILSVGCYESIEAVLLYQPDLEFSTPFTLLIILMVYLFPPLRFKPILLSALLSSIAYVLALAIFSVPAWQNCIQLALFFLCVNVLGSYLFLETMKSQRLQFVALDRIAKLNKRLQTEIEEKEKANAILETLATTDELTGIPNRRKFFEMVSAEIKRAQRYEHPVSLLMIDIDHFKKINDSLGHHAGDLVLKKVAQTIYNALRTSDHMGRLGGEEFGLILPQLSVSGAWHVAERHRINIEELRMAEFPDTQVTVSIGIAEASMDTNKVDELFKMADRALYQAKNSGRNRSLVA